VSPFTRIANIEVFSLQLKSQAKWVACWVLGRVCEVSPRPSQKLTELNRTWSTI